MYPRRLLFCITRLDCPLPSASVETCACASRTLDGRLQTARNRSARLSLKRDRLRPRLYFEAL